MKNPVFKKLDGTIIEDVLQYVKDFINKYPYCDISIGCDSQMHTSYAKYVTTICMHEIDECGIGKGVHVISTQFLDYSKNLKTDLYTKLWQEAELSIITADLIKDCGKKISVHLDYNSDNNALSNALYDAGLGYAKSKGYDALGKPDAHAATFASDHLCR